MAKNSQWMCQMLAITGALMSLTGCGSSESNDAQIAVANKTQFPTYVEKLYRSEKMDCVDLNLNGVCSDGESQEVSANTNNNSTSSPIIKSYDGFSLTAVASSSIITPFTTLINNEVMYNPLVKGDIGLAKAYLTSKFSLDFSELDLIDGPELAAAEIINSLKKANQLVSSNPYLNIAAAVDLMVFAGKFTVEPLQIHLDKLMHPELTQEGSYSLDATGQVSVSNFDLHPVTGRMIILTDDDTRIALNANTGAYAVVVTNTATDTTPSQPSSVKPSYSAPLPQKDSDEYEEEEVEYEEDEEDYLEAYAEWLAQQNGSTFNEVQLIKQSIATNKFYLLTVSSEQDIATTCESTGTQGLFLMAMDQEDTTAAAKTSAQKTSSGSSRVGIDAYSAASTPDVDIFNPTPTPTPDVQLPDAIPGVDNSEASCYNTSFKLMAITDDSTVIAVVAKNTQGDTIHRLSGDKLTEQFSPGYKLATGISVVDITVSNNGDYVAFTDNTGRVSLVNFNTMTLLATYSYPAYSLTKLHFISDQQLAVIGKGSNNAGVDNQVLFINSSNNSLVLSQAFTVSHAVEKLAVNQSAQLVAVANEQDISVIKLTDTGAETLVSYPDAGQQINQIGLLSDKVIFNANASLHYISLEGILGSELRAAQRYVTETTIMKQRLVTPTADINLPTSIDSLETVTITWSTNYPDQLDVTDGHVSYTHASDLTVTAHITGLFRGEMHTVEKLYKIQ